MNRPGYSPVPTDSVTPSTQPRRHAHLLALAIYALGYALLSFPAVLHFHTHYLCDGGDGLQNVWNDWWVRKAIAEHRSPYFTDWLMAPDGVTLVGATLNPFNGLCTVPLCWVTSDVVAYNATVLLAFVLGGYTTFLLAHHLTGSYWGSVFAGAALTFSPYHFAHAVGHMQLVSLQWFPLFFLTWVRLLEQPSHRRGLAAAGALFLNVLCDYYYTLYAVAGGAVLLAYHWFTAARPRGRLVRELVPALLTFALAAAASTGLVCGSLLAAHLGESLMGSHAGQHFSADVLGWLVPGSMWRFASITEWFWGRHPQHVTVSEFGLHLGVTVLGLVALGLWRGSRTQAGRWSRAWVILGVLAYALAMGPDPIVAGRVLSGVPMPYDLLAAAFPLIELSGNPVRMAFVTTFCAALLAARGVAVLPRLRWWRRWLAVPLLIAFALEVWPRPQATFEPTVPPSIRALRGFPAGSVAGIGFTGFELWLQTRFDKPITAGYVARVPTSRQAYCEAQVGLVRAGRYAELLRTTGATYLMWQGRGLGNGEVFPEVRDTELKSVASDHLFQVYTWATSPLPEVAARTCSAAARVRVEPVEGAPGRIAWRITSEGDAGRPYLCAFSLNRGYSVPLPGGGGAIELDGDSVFRASLQRGSAVFAGNHGELDARGGCVVSVRDDLGTPRVRAVWFSLVVFDPNRAGAVCRISPPQQLELRR